VKAEFIKVKSVNVSEEEESDNEEQSSYSRCKLEGGLAATDEGRASTWRVTGEGARVERQWVDAGARQSDASLLIARTRSVIESTESPSGGLDRAMATTDEGIGSRMNSSDRRTRLRYKKCMLCVDTRFLCDGL
jgi:hypothetical protein